ncbi:MAG TPA: glycosyltransferase family 4 protein [Thermoanaerobaculia bacterium]
MLKILHLAAGNRWTGAAAPAFAEVEALRAAGVDAHYAYVGGYKLEEKLRRHDFAHPLIEKAQNPFAFRRTLNVLHRMVDHHRFDVIHAHLTYDHWIARFLAQGHDLAVARTFHARRVLRSDPFTRSLIRKTKLLCVVNDTFRDAAPLAGRNALFTPPPLDHRQFDPVGADVRITYNIPDNARLLTVIGKLAPGRGFEDALRTFALVRREVPMARMMVIGHGPHRPVLEQLARDLEIAPDVLWAGYHEDDLTEHYRASDLLLFTARGSDEGHRAILEAMACGVPPAVFPIDGVQALLGEHAPQLVADHATPEALAVKVTARLAQDLRPMRTGVAAHSQQFGYRAAAGRLIAAYSAVL